MNEIVTGAFIGGGAALAGAICTSIATYYANKHGEKTKIRISKKEELYMELYSIKEAIESISREISSRESTIENMIDPFEKFSLSRKRSQVIIALYFEELKDKKEKYSKLLDAYIDGFIMPNYEKCPQDSVQQ